MNLLCVSTLIGDSILAKRVYRDCPISMNHKNTMIDHMELKIEDFVVILGMEWIHAYYISINY